MHRIRFSVAPLPRFLLALGLLTAAARADEPALLPEARQALSESLPDIAIYKLRKLLGTPDLPITTKSAATLLLAQAQAAAGANDDALATVQPLVAHGDEAGQLLRAGVLAHLGRWEEARPLYHALAVQPNAPVAATIGEAESLQALGRTEDAVLLLDRVLQSGQASTAVQIRHAVLLTELGQGREAQQALAKITPATPEETKWKSYADARLLLLQEQPAPALRMFEDILERREELPEALHVAATFGATDARLVLRGTEGADDVLETFIWRNPYSPYLASVFRRLDQIYAAEDDASDAELQKWSLKGQPQRAALALFYMARLDVRAQRWEKADAALHRFFSAYPTHPLGVEASLLQSEVDTAYGRLPEVVRALEEAMRRTQDANLRPTLELRTGLAHYQQGEFLLSATLFEDAARHSEKLRAVGTYNAALAWLHVPNLDRFRETYRVLAQQWPDSPLRSELLLEEGLVQARSQDPHAGESLKAFLRDYPRSPRRAEARLALAELGLASDRDPEAAAAQYLQVSDPIPASPEIAAKTDYLEIFLADSHHPPEDEKVIALAQKYLNDWPKAAEVLEVRMKLGQVYFRRGDYANAETQFMTLTEASPDGPYTESALFLAGESAVKLINPGAVDRALGYFDRVIKMEGSLKLYARQEQALVQERLEHEDQAIALYEIILSTAGVDAELWQAALCGKGNCLATIGRRELPAKDSLEKSVTVFSQLAGSPRVAAAWRNQALYKKGKALELLGRTDDAQAAFYDALNTPAGGEREYFWFYKAGFDAAHVYEQQEKWKAAIGIYQKMAAAQGPRTVEAQNRLRQVRLEHFIWD